MSDECGLDTAAIAKLRQLGGEKSVADMAARGPTVTAIQRSQKINAPDSGLQFKTLPSVEVAFDTLPKSGML
jgi:hypothetical protein